MNVVCDICRCRRPRAEDASQNICATCLRQCREQACIIEPRRAGPIPTDLLPLAAHFEHGPVKVHPTRADVDLASLRLDEGPVARWHFEETKRRFAGVAS